MHRPLRDPILTRRNLQPSHQITKNSNVCIIAKTGRRSKRLLLLLLRFWMMILMMISDGMVVVVVVIVVVVVGKGGREGRNDLDDDF